MTKTEHLRAALATATDGRVSLNSTTFWDSRRDIISAVPQLLALWGAAEAECSAVCWSQWSDGAKGNCVCGRDADAKQCPVTQAHAAVLAVLIKGLP